MRPIAHLPLQLGITAALAVVLSFVVPVFVDRHEYAKAVADYVKNPNSENDAVLKTERAKNQRVALETHVVAAGVLFVLMNVGWLLIRKWPRKSPNPD